MLHTFYEIIGIFHFLIVLITLILDFIQKTERRNSKLMLLKYIN